MIHQHFSEEGIPKFYGATTIGERGQIVVPAEARKDMNLTPSTKVMVFGGHRGEALIIVKADAVAEMLARANKMINGVEEILKSGEDVSS